MEKLKESYQKNSLMQNILKVVFATFSIFFCLILINTIFCNRTIKGTFKITSMLILPIAIYSVLYILDKKISLFNREIKNRYIVIFMIIIAIIQIILAKLTYASCGWDCGRVLNNAIVLLRNEAIDSSYFLKYTNNIGILMLFKYLFTFSKMFTEITIETGFFSAIVLNVLIVNLSAFFTILTCKKILGTKSMYLSLVFILPLILFSPYNIIPYTDTLTLIFPILILYLYIVIKNNKQNLIFKNFLIFIQGMLLAIGIIIKPTVVIIEIAIILTEILFLEKKEIVENANFKKIRNIIVSIIIFVIGFVSVNGIFNVVKAKNLGNEFTKQAYEQYSFPLTHFAMMGMQEQVMENQDPGILYGSYNGKDIAQTNSILGYKNKIKFNITKIKERLQEFGVAGYIKFLYNKANWILCDGTFFYGREGTFWNSKQYNESKFAKIIQPYLNVETEEFQKVTANIMQTAWILILFGLITSLKKQKESKEISICKLAVIGIVLFILIFEGRSRYLINYIPIFILVGTYGIKNSFELLNNKKRRGIKDGKEKSNTCNTNVL